jgi:hypothetical protein
MDLLAKGLNGGASSVARQYYRICKVRLATNLHVQTARV